MTTIRYPLHASTFIRTRIRPIITPVLTTVISATALFFTGQIAADSDSNPLIATNTLTQLSQNDECRSELAIQLSLISIHSNDPLMEANLDLANRCGNEMVQIYQTLVQNNASQRARGDNIGPINGLINFETPHVHPIDLTPNGNTLVAVNTAAHRLEVWQVAGASLSPLASIPVGLDPVSVRARSNTEVWVVNQISDSVSIVDLGQQTVIRTLKTDNEPADVVFAGPNRVFVTASESNTVNVFDLGNLDASAQTISINGEDPRALAVSADGQTVFAAIFESGNGTRHNGTAFSGTGSIVRDNQQTDNDIAIINANSLSVSYRRRLMNMVMAISVQPSTGEVFAVGTEAFNEIPNEPALNGKFVKVHMASFVGAGLSGATISDLNPHLDYVSPTVSSADRQLSIGDPRGIAWRDNGQSAFITGMGSNNVIVIDNVGNRVSNIEVGEGPTGIVLKDAADLGFVMNKFSGSISVIDLNSRNEISSVSFDDPTPQAVKAGRPLLYDTHLTSGTGHLSCGSCHVDARTDRLGWQLSDGLGTVSSIPQASNSLPGNVIGQSNISSNKQVMTTQTLLDIMEHPRFHWRGDRETIDDFNGTFVNLMGRSNQISQSEMDAFKTFLRTLWLPPNPYRNLDNSRPQTVILPDGSSATSNRVGSGTTDALRGGGNTNNCLICHSGQGNATRNFGANPEIASNIIAPAFPALYDKMGFSFNRSGFGFFHHGGADLFEATRTREFLAEILTLEGPEGPLVGDEIRQAPHAGVGQQLTVTGAISTSENTLLNQLVSIANNSSWADLIAHSRSSNLQRGFVLSSGESFESDIPGSTTTKDALLVNAANGDPVTFTLVAAGMAQRLALDSDLDGVLNNEGPDTDGDGIPDAVDPDDDNDGVLDVHDDFPLDASEQIDTDGDGIGNNADNDDDNDGTLDVNDDFPLDASEQIDTDGDGIGNNADTDDDNDGTPDDQDPAPLDPNIGGGNVLVIDKSVASRSDDAEQQGSGTVLLSSSDLELVFAGGSNQVVGMRFNGVGVPQGAEIVNAYIQFQTDEATSVTTNLNITGEATDNARAYQSATNDISSRSGTASSVAWSPAPWDQVGEAGLDQRTPNIGQVIQEIVSRPGWDAGNSLAVMIDGTGDRVAESFDGDSSGAPRLHIEFVNDDVGGTDTDNDGLPDSIDPDDDDDGVLDVNDDFPLDASEQTDTDGDGIGNNADTDDDNDGTPDDQDPAPLDPSIPGNGTISTDATVASRSDDAEQQGAGSVLLNSRDLELVFAAGADQTVGLRFNAVDVPQGAQIVNAYVQFQTDEATSVTTSLNITGEATDNAQTYQATTNNISSRPRTPSVVAWSPVPWNQIGQAGPDQRTPNINQVIQEIVARPGWSAGNSLAIMIDGTGDRVAMAFDGSATGAPRLHIDYVAGGGSSVAEKRIALSGDDVEETSTGAVKFRSSDLEMTSEATQQTIGLRFAGMEIPAGATITRAYVQFQVDARSSITTDLLFQGEDTDNAPPFLSASGNVSTRALTSAAIPWSVLPWNTVGAAGPAQRTPNLAPVIQELVDRAGWSAGNAVVLVVTGTGKRTAEAFDGADGGAPLLHVEFQ